MPTALSDFYPYLLACLCVWREGRSQSQEARRGIWWVLQNRVGKPLFRPSLVRCILQPWAFTSMCDAKDANIVKFPNEAVPADWQAWQEILAIAESSGADPTSGAVYYESVDPVELDELRVKSPWFAAENMTIQIDQVRFYRA